MRRFLVGILSVVLFGLGAHEARADTLGQTQTFLVNTSYDALGASAIQSTLRAIGARGYFYVDDRHWDSLSSSQRTQFLFALNELSFQFDTAIYPNSVREWGSEAVPGVDGDPRVVVLLERVIPGSGGYFETIHNYSKERAPQSNAREMVFVTVDAVVSGYAKNYLAHEFQHLISFYQRDLLLNVSDDLWLNEARSEYNVTAVGYSVPFEGSTLQRRVQSFLRGPSDSLTEWPNTSSDYAIASVFIHYLADRFGEGIVASTVHTTAAGTAALDGWLAAHGSERFGDVFSDWMIASLLNDRSIDSAYGYVRDGLSDIRVSPTMSGRLDTFVPQADFTVSLKEWQPFWVAADVSVSGVSQDAVHVQVSGAPDVTWRGAVIAVYRDGSSDVRPFMTSSGMTDVAIPVRHGGAELFSLNAAVTQGSTEPIMERRPVERGVTVRMTFDDQSPPQQPASTFSANLTDGDLIRRPGQDEIYVVWGHYRRYLTRDILKLYGFENRPVTVVSDSTFFSYDASVYIRAQDTKKVYAVWPDGTKHWLNISAAQWDASGRDWGAIFTVNNAETEAYATGVDIIR